MKTSTISHVEKWSKNKRIISVATAGIECLLFSGIIFGWPGIQYVYEQNCYFIEKGANFECDLLEKVKESQYLEKTDLEFNQSSSDFSASSTCTPGNLTNIPKCVINQQQLELSDVLRRSVQGFILTAFFFGLFFDKFGTRIYRLCVTIVLAAGCLVFTQATRGNEFLLFIGGPLVQIGGMSIFISNLKITSLFPAYQGTLVAFINGALEASACTFLIPKFMYQFFGLEPEVFWWVWFGLALVFITSRTCFLMPKVQIREKSMDNELEVLDDDKTDESVEKNSENSSFFHHIFSFQYLFHIIWLCILDFWNITFIGLFSSWSGWLVSSTGNMANLSPSELSDKSTWTNIWGFYQFVGAPLAMIVGMIMDRSRKNIFKNTGDLRKAQLQSTALVLALTTVFGSASAFLASLKFAESDYNYLQLVTFTFQLTFRACLYGNHATALLMLYPPELFGKLFGVVAIFTIGGAEMGPVILAFIQNQSSFETVYRIISLFLLGSLVYPAYLYKISI